MQRTNTVFKGPMRAAKALGFGQPSEWHELLGGRTNCLFWGEFPDGKRVFKFFDEKRSNSLFSNDIYDEKIALLALSGTGLAPILRGCVNTDFGMCIVYDFVNGIVPQQTTVATIKALSRLHSHQNPQGLRRVPSDPSAILKQGLSFLEHDRSNRAEFLRANVPEVPNLDEGIPSFLHGDPTPANSVIIPQGVTFVDWQCPAVGDPVHDLAIALSPAMHVVDGAAPLSVSEVDGLLVAYADASVTDRFRALAPLYRWRMACYCQWKSRLGETEFSAAGLAEFN